MLLSYNLTTHLDDFLTNCCASYYLESFERKCIYVKLSVDLELFCKTYSAFLVSHLFHCFGLFLLSQRAFTVGIGGPVGSGKTALVLSLCKHLRESVGLCVVTNDIFTRWVKRGPNILRIVDNSWTQFVIWPGWHWVLMVFTLFKRWGWLWHNLMFLVSHVRKFFKDLPKSCGLSRAPLVLIWQPVEKWNGHMKCSVITDL